MMRVVLIALSIWAGVASSFAQSLDIVFKPVTKGVYAFVGDLGGRSIENEGLNANLGLIVTASGAILIDSGATYQSAKRIEQAAGKVTDQPIRWVINTGGQDHRWLGNGYFKERGAETIAHQAGEADMRNRGGDQLAILRSVLGNKADATVPSLATRWLTATDETLEFGGQRIQILYRGGGHTPGDIIVWLPSQNVVFSGDLVYVDRLLGVIPVSNTKNWLAGFAEIERLQPKHIVPGHGEITNLELARNQTKSYLQRLRDHMRAAVEKGTDISIAVKAFDATAFDRLRNAKDLGPGNASRVYLEMERE